MGGQNRTTSLLTKIDLLKEFEINLAYHFSEVLEYPLAKPHWVYIGLSHRCTYECRMCRVIKIAQDHELENQIAKNALLEISRWKIKPTIVITGGEPLLRNDLFDIIAYAVTRDLPVEMVSNGALINQELASRLIASGLKNIAISLDGAKEATHDFIRKEGAFQKAAESIKLLSAAKKKAGGGPQLSIWTTIMKENVRELSQIIPLAREWGVECLVYHPVVVVQDDMQNTAEKGRFWVGKKDLGILKEEIDKLLDYQAKHGLVAFLHDPYLWIKFFQGSLTKREWRCNPFVFASIGPNGEIRSCGSSFGNIHETSLEESLASDSAQKARRAMKLCEKPCLQTCWALPQADSLKGIIDTFIADANKTGLTKEEKTQLLDKALGQLLVYENLLKEKCAI